MGGADICKDTELAGTCGGEFRYQYAEMGAHAGAGDGAREEALESRGQGVYHGDIGHAVDRGFLIDFRIEGLEDIELGEFFGIEYAVWGDSGEGGFDHYVGGIVIKKARVVVDGVFYEGAQLSGLLFLPGGGKEGHYRLSRL